ncbi:PepSY domain-containing protein [Salinicoccus albus]|uniref:PepSY domain-containing protein n=1 Tax=Salinicoccus albus TaxID=418756 RepID=UPI00037BE30E|nr:PepSY domain-containing protein [Salinicoccus albus]
MAFKKNSLFIGTLASALVLGACSSVNAETNLKWQGESNEGKAEVAAAEEANDNLHTAQEAVDLAISNFAGEVEEVQLDEDDGLYHYEIEINNGSDEYEVDVNAHDLTILEEDFDKDDDNDNRDDEAEKKTAQGNSDIHKKEEAAAAAKENFDGDVEEVELDEDDGVLYYEIEMHNGSDEYEVDINAEDLSIIEEDYDGDNDRDEQTEENASEQEQKNQSDQKSNSKSAVSSEEAIEIAQNEVGGGKVDDWEKDDGKFEIELDADGTEYEVEVKAADGEVLEVEQED